MTRERRRRYHFSWMIRRNLNECVAIEHAAGGDWTFDTFEDHLRHRNVIGIVATGKTDATLGFSVYELHKHHLDVLKLAVPPEYRGKGVGSDLLGNTRYKLESHRRNYLTLPGPNGLWDVKAYPENLSETVLLMCAARDTPPLWVMADALQDAGCEQVHLLEAMRRGGRFGEEVYQAFKAATPTYTVR